eukprot:2159774-Rhodomonas_salina.4
MVWSTVMSSRHQRRRLARFCDAYTLVARFAVRTPDQTSRVTLARSGAGHGCCAKGHCCARIRVLANKLISNTDLACGVVSGRGVACMFGADLVGGGARTWQQSSSSF